MRILGAAQMVIELANYQRRRTDVVIDNHDVLSYALDGVMYPWSRRLVVVVS